MRPNKIRFQPQAATVECGAACLAMVLTSFGVRTTVRQLRAELGIGRDGASALALATVARQRGLQVDAFRCESRALPEMATPAIAFVGFNHFVVIERVRRDRVYLVDPGEGRRVLRLAEFAADFTGVLLSFAPTAALRRATEGNGLLAFVARYVPRRWGTLGAIAGFSILLTMLGLVPAALTGHLVDKVIPSGSTHVITILAGGLGALIFTELLIRLARAELLLILQNHIDIRLMTSFLGHLLRLPFGYFQLRTSGDLLNRVGSNAVIRELVTTQALALALDIASAGLYLVLLTSIAPDYALIILVFAILQIVLVLVTTPRARDLAQRELQATSEEQSYMVEAIVGVESVKVSGAEDHVYGRWERLFGRHLAASRRRSLLDLRLDSVAGAVHDVLSVGLALYGAHQVITGELTLGRMFALTAIAGSLLVPLESFADHARALQTVTVHLARLKDVFDEQPEQSEDGPVRAVRLTGRLELRNVTFGYGAARQPAVLDVSLRCSAGALIAIVGRTGSGKSTLAKLMLGLYRPRDGEILFDGVELSELDVQELRRQCGVVTQNAAVFSGSILSNIALAAPEALLDEVVEAARAACLHEDVMRMPMRYETVLSEGGLGLSGGQKQRLALARALIARPKLILLDEATSALDSRTEAEVHHNLEALNCTRIVIAHRLSTVRNADVILVMDDGEVVEQGRHHELVAADGVYAKLVEAQTAAALPPGQR